MYKRQFQDGVYLSVYTAAGEPLYGAVPGQFDNTSAFSDRRMRAVGTMQNNWYVYDARHEIDGYGVVWVRGVASADDVNSTLRAMLRLALVVFPFFVVLAAVGGYLIGTSFKYLVVFVIYLVAIQIRPKGLFGW